MHFMMIHTWQDAYKEVTGYEVAWMAAQKRNDGGVG
jgi:hypothetical protein